jgi:alkylation response protein AidB-like acyl-CoA dehydrogenase
MSLHSASYNLSEEEQMLVDTVRAFIDRDVKPTVNEVEHANEYPAAWIDQMKEMIEQMRKDGLDVWPGYAHTPLSAQVSIYRSLLFAQSNDYAINMA